MMGNRTWVGLVLVMAVAACGGSTSAPDAELAAIDSPPAPADARRTDGATGDGSCLGDPAPPGGACPPACTGGCADGVCTIQCGAAACADQTITCPADFACAVVCAGIDACDTSVIQCPADYACTLSCDQYDACGDVQLACGAASCAIECLGGGGEACGGSTVHCGTGACQATCAGVDVPIVDCGAACSCAPCT